MRKIHKIWALFSVVCLLIACDGDNDYTYKMPETLNVVSSNLYFKSAGGTGKVMIETDKAIKATSTVEWCTLQVEGGVITAIVSENTSRESRDGLVTLTDGALSTELSLHQEGLALDIIADDFNNIFSNEGGTTSLIISSTSPYTFSIPEYAQAWLSVQQQDGAVVFTCAKNETGAPRAASVVFKVGDMTENFYIAQYEEADILTTWKAQYTDADGKLVETTAKVTKDESENITLSLYVTSMNKNYNFGCTYGDGELDIKIGAALGMFSSYYLYSAALSTSGSVSWNLSVTYAGNGICSEAGNFIFAFDDDGSWSGKTINGVGIWAFKSTTLNNANSLGYLELISDLKLYK
ncbi:BACON domain-containing protein [Bacteroides graminisolvens]